MQVSFKQFSDDAVWVTPPFSPSTDVTYTMVIKIKVCYVQGGKTALLAYNDKGGS